MTDPREMALLEQRERIKHAAERQTWVAYRVDNNSRIVNIKLWIDVFYDDPDFDIHGFKCWLASLYQSNADNNNISSSVLEIHDKSFNTIADELYEQIAQHYPDRSIKIEVSENGEHGISVCYKKRNSL